MASSYHVLIVYRNFYAKSGPASHVGLGVNALVTARCLRNNGVLADALGVWTVQQVTAALTADPSITHCIIEAPWIATTDLQTLLQTFPRIEFVVRCHSQIGFLQVEAGAIALFRQDAALQAGQLNFKIAGNSERFTTWFSATYGQPVTLLPNLYAISPPAKYVKHNPGNPLDIASFGALRLMKNHATAAAAAMLVAKRRNVDLRFHINANREENGKGILQSLRNMFAGLSWATLVEEPWLSWPDFKQLIASMDCCLQLSFSETFNLVTADAADALVPSVVGQAIDWVPSSWQAPEDSPEGAGRILDYLLSDSYAGPEGKTALATYTAAAVLMWKQYLSATAATAGMNLPPLA